MALAGGLAAASLAVTWPVSAQVLPPAEARQIAEDAYVYGYSLISTEVTGVQGSNVAKPDGIKAPTGQLPKYARARRDR